jgi:Leu/Phe-tRNA-protein transferase
MVVMGHRSEAAGLAHELEQWIKKLKCSGTTGLSLGNLF